MIGILLSTYNGEKYLEEQLDSLLGQTISNWRLLCRDDGSSDSTLAILHKFERIYPSKIVILKDNLGNVGSCASYQYLLENCSDQYIMFCDQDDVWLKDKIEKTYAVIKAAEDNNNGVPVLVCTDLLVVNERLEQMSSSMWKHMRNKPRNVKDIYELGVNNYVTGCTMMINSVSRRYVLPFSPRALMHDWWIALKICKNGVIITLEEPTILYRQHQQNVIGSVKTNYSRFYKRLIKFKVTVNENKRLIEMLSDAIPNFNFRSWMVAKCRFLFLKFIKL